MLKPNIKVKQMAYKYLMVIMLGIITLGLSLGCEDSPESAARKQVNDSIEQTSQLIQQGNTVSGGAAGGLQTDQESFNNTLSDWDQMVSGIAPNDTEALKTAAYQITRIGRELIEQEGLTSSQSSNKMQEIQQILIRASAAARQSGNRGAQAGPDLLLATIYLSNARDKVNQLTQLAAQIHTKQAVISDLLSSLVKEQKISIELENSRPTERINLLKERLGNLNTGLEQDLANTEANVNQLLSDRAVLQKQYQTARDAAVALQRQYNELLIQADNAEGAERFKLQQQAYNLQVGYEKDGNKVIGSIELEAQTQKWENQLTALESKLQYQLLWQGIVREDVRLMKDTIDQLQSAELSQSITRDYDKSIQRQGDLIELISKHLNELQTAAEQYAALRQEAVEPFNSARDTYDSVTMVVAGSTRDYAQTLKLIATKELAQMWLNDASHNQLGKTILVTAVKIPEINSLAVPIQQACEQAQANATQKAQDLEAEIAAAQADETVGGYPGEATAGGYPDTGGYPEEAIQVQPPEEVTTPPTIGEPNAPGGDRGIRGNRGGNRGDMGSRGDRSGRSDRGGRGRGGRGNQVSEPNRIR